MSEARRQRPPARPRVVATRRLLNCKFEKSKNENDLLMIDLILRFNLLVLRRGLKSVRDHLHLQRPCCFKTNEILATILDFVLFEQQLGSLRLVNRKIKKNMRTAVRGKVL